MYCKSCGFEIENDSKYCRRCGNSVTGDVAGEHKHLSSQAKTKITLAVGIAVALVIAAITFLLFFTIDESPTSKAGNTTFYENIV